MVYEDGRGGGDKSAEDFFKEMTNEGSYPGLKAKFDQANEDT